ncbi:GNAT family N-acetyltransferase [Alteromonas ponticola]|uniref:GNAT family N-acetyltransferase n=1 Tax=Alteromonas ponticola TaxID=2720613 RepID=A0ABX1R1Y9_9ALTE|nr:GNAT family N-acetyltransferase [Alteromonas ponticola]NMH59641.1 GNAT family N-acetyltransferase [Alteromonas ponticola]
MTKKKFKELFRKAGDPGTDTHELDEIIELGNNELCAVVALNPSCDKYLLDKLALVNSTHVKNNLAKRYSSYPDLYSINVREVEISDAEYIFTLRMDDVFNRYISKVTNDVRAQEEYIEKYLLNNAVERTSFYFILENRLTGVRCGTVRIYNFDGDVFEWGSWILDGNKTRFAAMETAILIYEFAFNVLGFSRSEFEVNKDNKKVISYHQKSGAEIIGEDDVNLYFRVSKVVGLNFAKKLREKLETKHS